MDPDTTAKIGLTLWEHVPYLKDAVRGIRRKLRDGKTVLAVFGPGGVGKTTLGAILSGQTPAAEYVDSPDTDTVWLKTDDVQSVLIAPGQASRIAVHWPAIQTALARAELPIVVNVVAWGYHTPLKERSMSVEDLPVYVTEAQGEEFRIAAELAGFFTGITGPLKMLTLVTKQDLWWPERDAVKSHYETGEYATQIARIQAAKGNQNFSHEFAYVSLMQRNLESGRGETLIPTAQGYDVKLTNEGHVRLMQTLEGMLK